MCPLYVVLPFLLPRPPSLPLHRAPQAGPAGYRMTHTIPALRRGGKRQEEMLMTSVSWLTPPSSAQHSNQTEMQTVATPPLCPGINTCRPMSFQEDGAKVDHLDLLSKKSSTKSLVFLLPLLFPLHTSLPPSLPPSPPPLSLSFSLPHPLSLSPSLDAGVMCNSSEPSNLYVRPH